MYRQAAEKFHVMESGIQTVNTCLIERFHQLIQMLWWTIDLGGRFRWEWRKQWFTFWPPLCICRGGGRWILVVFICDWIARWQWSRFDRWFGHIAIVWQVFAAIWRLIYCVGCVGGFFFVHIRLLGARLMWWQIGRIDGDAAGWMKYIACVRYITFIDGCAVVVVDWQRRWRFRLAVRVLCFVDLFLIIIRFVWSTWLALWRWWIDIFGLSCRLIGVAKMLCGRWWNITLRIICIRFIHRIVVFIFVREIFVRWHLCIVRNFVCESFDLKWKMMPKDRKKER